MTANRIRGKVTGALFFSGFGALWLVFGMSVRGTLDGGVLAAVVAGTVLIAAAGAMVMREAGSFKVVPGDPRVGRLFLAVNIAQWAAIFTAVAVLKAEHLEVWNATAIAAIVALHLFPLAKLFHNRLNAVTGAVLLVWTAAVPLLVGISRVQSTTALGAGVILLTAAVAGIMSARRLVHLSGIVQSSNP